MPDTDPSTAYGEGTVPIKDAPDDGETLFCISAPSIVAIQLEQLAPQAGQRVLEAGLRPATTPRCWGDSWELVGMWTSTKTWSQVRPPDDGTLPQVTATTLSLRSPVPKALRTLFE